MDTSQLRTILWLRWRLSRNQWARAGSLGVILTGVVVAIGLAIGFGGAVVGLLAGIFALPGASPSKVLVIWDVVTIGFLFFSMVSIVSEIQRSEAIDIGRMLHLPISLRQVFVINYLASHLSVNVILFVPGMLGLAIGLILGGGLGLVWMLPLVIGFVFMITSWIYCLRGWLVTLMINPRRRRAIIAGVTVGFVLLTQLPNLLVHTVSRTDRHRPGRVQSQEQDETPSPSRSERGIPPVVLTAHKAVPVLWVGNGARALALGDVRPAMLAAVATFGIGALGLRRAYRSTIRFYQGGETGRKIRRKAKPKTVARVRDDFSAHLPGIPDEASALAQAFFRSLKRAPEVKMALAMNLMWLIIFGGMVLFRRSSSLPEGAKPFIATAVVGVTFFGMAQLMFNLFGFDRGGFRTLVLLPTRREWILLGKNLAVFPIAIAVGTVLLALASVALSLPATVMVAAILQLLAAFLLLSMTGSLLSVLVPYRVAPGSMKPTKTGTTTALLIMVSHMLFPATMAPVFLMPLLGTLASHLGWAPAGPVNLGASAVLLAVSIVCYRLSLPALGNLLQQRERVVLDVVAREVE
jgi:ABC-2 type transport system permease protein